MTNLVDGVAAEIRAQLARRQMRQADLATILGLAQPAVSDRLRGRTPFTLADLERIAAHLEVDVHDLIPVSSQLAAAAS